MKAIKALLAILRTSPKIEYLQVLEVYSCISFGIYYPRTKFFAFLFFKLILLFE